MPEHVITNKILVEQRERRRQEEEERINRVIDRHLSKPVKELEPESEEYLRVLSQLHYLPVWHYVLWMQPFAIEHEIGCDRDYRYVVTHWPVRESMP